MSVCMYVVYARMLCGCRFQIVLSDGVRSGHVIAKSGMDALADSDAIFSYFSVHRMNPDAQVRCSDYSVYIYVCERVTDLASLQ
jgi:hypothetical protein